MTDLDRDVLRRLAEWDTADWPVSSFYMDVDGKRYPRKQELTVRAEELGHQLERQAQDLPKAGRLSVARDRARILQWIHDLDRGADRGVALFSSSAAGLWEEIPLPRPVRDHAAVADRPQILQLESLLETYESFCTVVVDREKARVFVARMGRIREQTDIFHDVPGQHDQGGWSQARYQRHIEEHVQRHLKDVADALLGFFKRYRFDHLILAGPDEVLPELARYLHDYLKQRIATRTTLSMAAGAAEVLQKSLAVEEAIEAERERSTVERLRAEAAAGRQAVIGLEPVLEALNDGRVDTLVVPDGLTRDGRRCSSCGRLATGGDTCHACGGALQTVPDVVESAVVSALMQRSRVESLSFNGNGTTGPAISDVGALLRY